MLYARRLAGVCAAVGLLTGCGGSAGGVLSPLAPAASPDSSRTFRYTGRPETFKVPSGVRSLKIAAYGASGDGAVHRKYSKGGLGAALMAKIGVKPGQTLILYVGGKARGNKGGFNGGATTVSGAYGGGGESDVRTGTGSIAERILVAGGGGGAGYGYEAESGTSSFYYCAGGHGGAGGASTGAQGGEGACISPAGGGLGGSQTAGGAGGAGGAYGGSTLGGSPGCGGSDGDSGSLHAGGSGASGCSAAGGGGGGGYYGGGGGGSAGCCSEFGAGGSGGGGGGGSSYVEKSATNVKDVRGGAARGNGKIVISW